MDVAFTALAVAHILIWAFVMLAWLHPRAAVINLTVIIPLIYVVHMLPFHVLTAAKQRMHPQTWQQDSKAVEHVMVVPGLFDEVRKAFDKSYANPLSAQGMLVLGAITSAWRLLL